MRLYSLALVFSLVTTPLIAGNISFVISSYEEGDDFQGNTVCRLGYSITNNTYGTIDRIRINLDAWDDRGDDLTGIFSRSLDNYGREGRWTSIPVGSTSNFTMSETLRARCEFIARLRVRDVSPHNCSIRMLPEEANCTEIVSVVSEIEHISVD